MARVGHDVTLVDAWPEHVEYMRKHGLQIAGMTPEERHSIPVRALHITDVQRFAKEKPIDIAFVSVKSYDTEWATRLIKPYLAPDGFVVSLQNCINEERIAAIVGWGKTMGCIASLVAAELTHAGHIQRTVPLGGEHHIVYRVGEVHGRVTPRALEVAGAPEERRQRESHDQLVGRALVEARRQLDAQRAIRRERSLGQ
jgi:2-dehydropantoate 2-reductase